MITLADYVKECEDLVEKLENEGLCTSDAQGASEAQMFIKYGVTELQLMRGSK